MAEAIANSASPTAWVGAYCCIRVGRVSETNDPAKPSKTPLINTNMPAIIDSKKADVGFSVEDNLLKYFVEVPPNYKG